MKSQNISFGIAASVLIIATSFGQAGRAQPSQDTPTPRVGQTRGASSANVAKIVEDLQHRVERLEAQAALRDSSFMEARSEGEAALGLEEGARAMQLLRFDSLDPDPSGFDRLKELNDEVKSLARTVESERKKLASLSGSGSGFRGNSNNRSGQRRRAQAQLLAEYQANLRKKQGEANRLERDLNSPKQLIHGHRGDNRVITLRTTKDLSGVLSRVDPGQLLKWNGRRLSFDGTTEEWVVSSISRYDRP